MITKDLLKSTLDLLRAYFGEATEVCLIGSSTLRCMGLLEFDATNEGSDIDILLIQPQERDINLARLLQLMNPGATKAHINTNLYDTGKKPMSGDKPLSKLVAICELSIGGIKVKVDIFQGTENMKSDVTFEGFTLGKISEMVKAKKSYNREKDKHQLKHLGSLFYDWRDELPNPDDPHYTL